VKIPNLETNSPKVRTLLHWCDSNAVFIVDVSRVYANSLPQKMARSKIKVHTRTAFLKIVRVVHEKKDKKYLRDRLPTF